MKLTEINVENVLGIGQINAALPTPVALFAGDNYAGKSSVREAVKLALIGVPERVLKKKDYIQIVHDSAEAGVASVAFEGGSGLFTVPAGKQELKHSYTMDVFERMALALPYCLNIEQFAQASNDERRSLLFAITGASAKTSDIVASLKARGVGDKIIETVTPLLRSGFPAAAEFAANKARDAKSDWKAVTHQTYGHVKAETWSAPVPAGVDTTELEQLQTRAEILKGKIGTEQTRLGAAEQRLKTWLQHTEHFERDQKLAAKLPSLEKKLEFDQEGLTKWNDRVKVLEGQAGTGPRVGLVHALAECLNEAFTLLSDGHFPVQLHGKTLVALTEYEHKHGKLGATGDPEAAGQLPEAIKARDLMQESVKNDHRDIDAAKAAKARLAQPVVKGSQVEVDAIGTILKGFQQEHSEVTAKLTKLQAEQRAAAEAVEATARARAHHEAVKQWQLAIDALSPDGIPAEILGKALVPLNNMLAHISKTFCWQCVQVDADMMITSGIRPFALQSESEKWRTDAILALAIANISGLKLVAMDRVDVLSLGGRTDLVDGLDQLAEQGFVDTALLFGTFKQLPKLHAFPQTTGFWVENGTIAARSDAVREAA